MVVIMIFWVLFVGLYMWSQPYFKRSRDTKRTTDIQSYLSNIISTYEKNFDTFPSNMWSGWIENGYCLSELSTRQSIGSLRDQQFSVLSQKSSAAPVDPIWQVPIPTICPQKWSYIYSRIQYGSNSEIAIISAELETRSSANYGTGSDLIDIWAIQNLINAKKSTVPDTAPNQLYIVTALH